MAKQTSQLLEELKGHDVQIRCVHMLSSKNVLTAAHDEILKILNVQRDNCVATIASAVLCMEEVRPLLSICLYLNFSIGKSP